MLYIGLAILLGTITMVAPLALLGPEDPITDTEDTLTVPEYTVRNSEVEEPDNQDRSYDDSKTSDLSPIGLMTVPSFLVALGVFVYLRKRMS
jgi:hypothetical protein